MLHLVEALPSGGIDDGVRLFALACAAVGLYDKYGVGTADDDVLLYGVVYHDGLRLGGGVPYGAARGEERQQGDDEEERAVHLICMVTGSSRLMACCMRGITLAQAARLLSTIPTALFSPRMMHPRVSAAVLPACMRMQLNMGTLCSCGRYLPKRGLNVQITLYVPVGIAVCPYTLRRRSCVSGMSWASPRSRSSMVSHMYVPFMLRRPMV